MRKIAQLPLVFGLVLFLSSFWLPSVARAAALTSSSSEAECLFNKVVTCPPGSAEDGATTCYACTMENGKPGDCLAYTTLNVKTKITDYHCEVEESCPEKAVLSGGGCERHNDSPIMLSETAPSANGWECTYDSAPGAKTITGASIDAYAVCVGNSAGN